MVKIVKLEERYVHRAEHPVACSVVYHAKTEREGRALYDKVKKSCKRKRDNDKEGIAWLFNVKLLDKESGRLMSAWTLNRKENGYWEEIGR